MYDRLERENPCRNLARDRVNSFQRILGLFLTFNIFILGSTTAAVYYSCDDDSDGFIDATLDGACGFIGCEVGICPGGTDGQTTPGSDCDDTDDTIYPGATESLCDGIDKDCDGPSDDHPDYDGDGYDVCDIQDAGDGDSLAADCDDNDASINPGATETTCNGIDENCNGLGDDNPDNDYDGYDACGGGDCDDSNPGINPGATEITCNSVDENCNGLADDNPDGDGDTWGVCDDCNDGNSGINPSASEICENGIDEDCDGLDAGCPPVCTDNDNDGYSQEGGPCGVVDCDDTNNAIYPGATETCGNGVDEDCNGSDEICACDDNDADGYNDVACGGTDCDDANSFINPVAREMCDGIDNNCNTLIDEGVTNTYYSDSDNDGWGNPLFSQEACSTPTGYVLDDTDCDDSDNSINPGAVEIDCDGIDNDCSIFSPDASDMDNDGFDACNTVDPGDSVGKVVDCNDNDNSIYPNAPEYCDGRDNQCPGDIGYGEFEEGCGDISFFGVSSASTPLFYFEDIITEGNTTVNETLINIGGEIPAGLKVSSSFFNISSDTVFQDKALVCIPYNSTSTDSNKLRLHHWNGNEWEDITVSLDTQAGSVCGKTESFSPFVVLEDTSVLGIKPNPYDASDVIIDEVPVLSTAGIVFLSTILGGLAARRIRRKS